MTNTIEWHRLPDQPDHRLPSSKKGVIRYTGFNPSRTYAPNGLRERTRRTRQLAKIEERTFRYAA